MKYLGYIIVFIVIILAALFLRGQLPEIPPVEEELWLVLDVLDMDAVRVKNGEIEKIVYLSGVNAIEKFPEKLGCYNQEAWDFLKEKVTGEKVKLIPENDKYYIILDAININAEMIRLGYATFYEEPIKLAPTFKLLEEDARKNGRGLWSACQFISEK